MKNLKKVFALVAIVLGCSMSAVAQNGLTVRLGGNFPVGAFGEGDKLGSLAIEDAKAALGGAAIGYNLGLKYQVKVIAGLGAFATADFFYNGLKEDIKEDLVEVLKVDDGNITLPSYMNAPVMLGLNYSFFNPAKVALWVEAGAGVNFRSITKKETGGAVGSLVSANGESLYDLATTFAWQAGLGVSFNNAITLGLHYYGFGSAPVEGESTSDSSLGGIINVETKPLSFAKGKLNPSMLVARVGITF